MGMLMVRCQKTGRAISTGRQSNPGYLAAPLYFSAVPTVRTAGRGMSGLSKTHGFAIPTTPNVNSRGKRRSARLFEMAQQTTQQSKRKEPLDRRSEDSVTGSAVDKDC
jgi:hypothetical protein